MIFLKHVFLIKNVFLNGKLDGFVGKFPTMSDWEDHVTVAFPEVRLKQYLEIRSIDACEWDCHCAAPAFYTGLIYGNLDEGLDVIKNWRSDEVINAYLDAPKKGLLTEIHGKNMIEWGKLLLKISKKGLENRNNLNKKNNDESVYLKNIENVLSEKKTKAEKSIKIA